MSTPTSLAVGTRPSVAPISTVDRGAADTAAGQTAVPQSVASPVSASKNAVSQGLLQVNALSMRFGGLLAVDAVSFSVQPREIFAVIGPNGAGKTTIFNCISGFYRPSSGTVQLAQTPVTGLPSHQLARQGLARTFQNIRLFPGMTALENLLVAQQGRALGIRSPGEWLAGMFNTPAHRAREAATLEHAAYWLDAVDLRAQANRCAGELAYGQQRRLEIARCMATRPRLLLLDEPAAGLNPRETEELCTLIRHLRTRHDLTVLLIEHDMRLVMTLSDRILVMDHGSPIATGTPAEIRANPQVIHAYLGQ